MSHGENCHLKITFFLSYLNNLCHMYLCTYVSKYAYKSIHIFFPVEIVMIAGKLLYNLLYYFLKVRCEAIINRALIIHEFMNFNR